MFFIKLYYYYYDNVLEYDIIVLYYLYCRYKLRGFGMESLF